MENPYLKGNTDSLRLLVGKSGEVSRKIPFFYVNGDFL